MTPEKLQRIQEHSIAIARLLFDEVDQEELQTLMDIERNVRNLSLEYVLPNIGVFLSNRPLTLMLGEKGR